MADKGSETGVVGMPGFRFHPTEQELVGYYLHRRIQGKSFPCELIPPLELYSHDPWELPGLSAASLKQSKAKEWYFFVPRNKKYPNAVRPNRVTSSGYWKATGTDREVFKQDGLIGLRKTLVFYKGRAPKGNRTNWVMKEYRLVGTEAMKNIKADISLCRVFYKGDDEEREIQSIPISVQKQQSEIMPAEKLLSIITELVANKANPAQNDCKNNARKTCIPEPKYDKVLIRQSSMDKNGCISVQTKQIELVHQGNDLLSLFTNLVATKSDEAENSGTNLDGGNDQGMIWQNFLSPNFEGGLFDPPWQILSSRCGLGKCPSIGRQAASLLSIDSGMPCMVEEMDMDEGMFLFGP